MPVTAITSMRRSPRLPGDDLQADAIDAPEGEELMPVTPITSMSHELAAGWRMPGAVGTLLGASL
jgi:hypothetical protein